jgi:hypothetical protein
MLNLIKSRVEFLYFGETEVWLMDIPEHMIHFKGDPFMKAK